MCIQNSINKYYNQQSEFNPYSQINPLQCSQASIPHLGYLISYKKNLFTISSGVTSKSSLTFSAIQKLWTVHAAFRKLT